MIKLVLTDMDDTLIPAGHDGASDYAIEGIHAMQAAGLHFGPVSGRQPSAMGWMFKNRSECYSTGAFCNGQVMFVDGEVVASRAIDNDALMRLADYFEQETDDTYLKVYRLGDDFWDNDAYCVTSDPERVRRAMESGGNAWLKGEEAPCRPVVDDAPVYKANIWSARSREELAELREDVRTDTVDDARARRVIVAVARKDQRAVRRLRGGTVQVQAHEQVRALLLCKVHASLHLAQWRRIIRAVTIGARHVHMDMAVRLELLL